jgi:hypothetical protein
MYELILFPRRATCPANLIPLDLVTNAVERGWGEAGKNYQGPAARNIFRGLLEPGRAKES